ncbi:MAG: protein kinase domain-containing protein [Verrucomicrobiota bacterium]
MPGYLELAVGSRLAGYEILRLVGRGGTGLVYEAEHLVLNRCAALKTLVPDLVDDAEFRERLTQESRLVAALDHPAVIPIYDAGESDGLLFVAMRFVRGTDLAELLARERSLDLETALGILEQVAGALDAAHARGLVHRDVKPANVLLEETTGRVYLSDFGIAKQTDAPGLTRTGYFLGTVDSAAPEQIQGLTVGPPADVYALGCTLYECLTGKTPFDRGTAVATLRAHLFDPPPPLPPELGLPDELDAVIARALAKEETERPQTCGELVQALREAAGIGHRTRAWTTLRRVTPANRAAMLPAETAPLFGRETELDRLDELLRGPNVRLITLTGLGGMGKSRLAVAAARTAADSYDEVVYVDLASVDEAEACGRALAEALCADYDGGPPIDALSTRFGGKRTLMVLDGFEGVLQAASLLAELLATCPQVVALVTSLAALRLREEQRFPVQPLPAPDPSLADDVDDLSQSAAVALFVDRARAVKPDFELTAENAPAVLAVCARVDGIPLAVELAAGRIDVLSSQALLAHLDHRLEFPAADTLGLPERQHTLRGAIDRTYELLAEPDRALFARLGVFAGGWSLDAAETIFSEPDGTGAGELINVFASLVDKGLVRKGEGIDGEPRFTMLDTVRDYAVERLDELGQLEDVRLRHAQRYVRVAETAEPELDGPGQLVWLARLEEDDENVSAALGWALDRNGDLDAGLRLAGALNRYWSIRGRVPAVRGWLEDALSQTDGRSDAVLAKARFACGCMASAQGDLPSATVHFERSLEIASSLGDARREAAAMAQLAALHLATGDAATAQSEAERALALADAGGDKVSASDACSVLADIAARKGDTEQAALYHERSLRLRRELGDRSLLAESLIRHARRGFGDREDGRIGALLQEGLDLSRRVGDTWMESVALCTQGALACVERDPADAGAKLAAALVIAHRRRDRRTTAECVLGLAAVAALTDDQHRAARLLGAARALRAATGAKRSSVERVLDELLEGQLEDLAPGGLEVEEAAGELLPLEDIVLFALDETARVGPGVTDTPTP